MPQMKDRSRTILRWTGGAAAVLLGALAVAAPITGFYRGDRAVIVSEYGDFTAAPGTMEAMKWLSERSRTNGFRFNLQGEVTHFRVILEPAEGVVLPVGEFLSESVRFDPSGRVIHISLPDLESDRDSTQWTQDATDPRYWFVAIEGDCPLRIDPTALVLSRECHS